MRSTTCCAIRRTLAAQQDPIINDGTWTWRNIGQASLFAAGVPLFADSLVVQIVSDGGLDPNLYASDALVLCYDTQLVSWPAVLLTRIDVGLLPSLQVVTQFARLVTGFVQPQYTYPPPT